MRLPGFVGPTYQSLSPNADDERCINLYPEMIESGAGKNTVVLYGTPGLRYVARLGFTTSVAPTRALLEINGRCFAVANDHFFEITYNAVTGVWTAITHGLVAVDGNPATMATNGTGGNQIFITSGGLGYIFNLATDMLTAISDVDLQQPVIQAEFVDGYFIALHGTTGQFQISTLEDGFQWDALDVQQVSQSSDKVLAMLVDVRQIWLFGGRTTAVWYDSGNADFPFEPTQTLFHVGILAPFTAQRLGGGVYWLGQTEDGGPALYRALQGAPQRVSTHAVEYQWSKVSTLTDAVGWTMDYGGHQYYVLYIPAAETTWVYDAITNLWHERAHWNILHAIWEPYIGRCHAYCFEKHLIGDRRTGAVYELRHDTYEDQLAVID